MRSDAPPGGPGQLFPARAIVEVPPPCKDVTSVAHGKHFLAIRSPAASSVTHTPVGMPGQTVRMLKQARTAVPAGMWNGTGNLNVFVKPPEW